MCVRVCCRENLTEIRSSIVLLPQCPSLHEQRIGSYTEQTLESGNAQCHRRQPLMFQTSN